MRWVVDFDRRTVFLALFLKFVLAFAVLSAFNGFRYGSSFRTLESGDTIGYLQPVENLLKHGVWAIRIGERDSYAKRPPLYGLFYLPGRFLAGQRAGEFLLVIFQVAVSALAAICFAKTVGLLCRSEGMAWVGLAFAIVNLQWITYDLRLLTESLALSAAVIIQYLLLADKLRRLRVSAVIGALAFVMVFLRPFLGVFFPSVALVMWLVQKRPWADIGRHGALIVLPFACACAVWTLVNYVRLGEVIFLQQSVKEIYLGSYRPFSKFLFSWGGDNIFWNPGSPAGWFEGWQHSRDFQFPRPVLEGVPYTLGDLQRAKGLMVSSGLALGSTQYAEATAILNKCAEEFKRAHPWDAIFMAPLRVLVRYLGFIQTDTLHNTNLYAASSKFRLFMSGSTWVFNALFLLGLAAYPLALDRWRRDFADAYGIMVLGALMHFVVIAAMFRSPEGRYGLATLWVAYPWSLWALYRRWRRERVEGRPSG